MRFFRNPTYLICAVIALCIFLLYGRVVGYAFWADDWNYLWLVTHPFKYPIISWLHPGTMIEFYVFLRLLGTNEVIWHSAGILIRIGAALSVYRLGRVVFRSHGWGMVSGLLFGILPIGFESVSWPSAHIVNLDVLFVTQAVSVYIESVRNGEKFPLSGWIWMSLAILFDPLRVLSLSWIPLVVRMKPFSFRWNKQTGALLSVCTVVIVYAETVFLPAYLRWYHGYLFGSSPTYIPGRIERFANTIGNLLIGGFIPLHGIEFDISKSTDNWLVSGIGSTAVLLLFYALWKRIRNHMSMSIAELFGWWIASTMFVQWLSDPEYLPSMTHRHFVIPAVGVSIVFAEWLRKLPNVFRVSAGVIVLIGAVSLRNDAFIKMDRYRKHAVVDQNERLLTGMYERAGSPPVIYLDNSSNRFVDPDNFHNQMVWIAWNKKIPFMGTFVLDPNQAFDHVCEENGFGITDPDTDVFAVKADTNGYLTDMSLSFRKQIKQNPGFSARCRGLKL